MSLRVFFLHSSANTQIYSSILYPLLRIKDQTLDPLPSTKAQPQLQSTSPETYQNISPHWSGVIPRAFSAS